MKVLESLLNNNKNWAKSVKAQQPEFFSDLSQEQTPEVLWIGCADSRVPETTILDFEPGQVFTHRNIANLVSEKDPSSMAVVSHAVNALKIKHIIICGHYSCGGVDAALAYTQQGPVGQWVQPIVELKHQHISELQALDPQQKRRYLAEQNIVKQVENLNESDVIQSIKQQGSELTIYGLIYDLETGLLKELHKQNA